jgi:hypothetical protein
MKKKKEKRKGGFQVPTQFTEHTNFDYTPIVKAYKSGN